MRIRTEYPEVEVYMLSCMTDNAHDREHVYRVLHYALDIAKHEGSANDVILIVACLLHDIGREEQYADPTVDHALCGAEQAYAWLKANGYDEGFSISVMNCIQTRRFRSDNQPQSIEAKILFDADKLDVCGAMGIARSLLYKAKVDEPLYTLTEKGDVSDGTNDVEPSFFQEYKFKLEKLYSQFYTKRGSDLARSRKATAENYYKALLSEANSCYSDETKSEIIYNKLIRDNISDIIKADGRVPVVTVLSDDKYINALNTKLQEEVNEYLADNSLDEICDILEVVYAIANAKGFSINTDFRRAA